MRVALVYDRVNKWGGAERVLLHLHEIFPKAPLYTSVYNPNGAYWAKVFPKVYTSFLQKIPLLRNYHEILGWLMPIGFEQFNFKNYDLVLSVTSESAKGIITDGTTKHICYCLTPTRYLWSGYKDYQFKPQWPFNKIPFFKFLSKPFIKYLKYWDKVASARPDLYVAISEEVQRRIKKYYHRDSLLLYPGINAPKSILNKTLFLENYYLLVSRLIPYKRIDLAIKTFNKIKKHLVIIGEGSQLKFLKNISKSNIHFIGSVKDNELFAWYKNAKAVIIPQKEDFGLVCLEAQIMGTPVIVYKNSGAVEAVINGKTGIIFKNQNVKSLKNAVYKLNGINFNRNKIIENAKRFSKDVFESQLLDIIKKQL